jgi:Protein of unknown function (DUF5674)
LPQLSVSLMRNIAPGDATASPVRPRYTRCAVTIINDTISLKELQVMAASFFGDMVKGVVDVERGLLALDAELHSELESLLLENGSNQQNLWGVNLYPELQGDSFLEFDSLINIRPSQGNRSRGVENPEIRSRIVAVVESRILQ